MLHVACMCCMWLVVPRAVLRFGLVSIMVMVTPFHKAPPKVNCWEGAWASKSRERQAEMWIVSTLDCINYTCIIITYSGLFSMG